MPVCVSFHRNSVQHSTPDILRLSKILELHSIIYTYFFAFSGGGGKGIFDCSFL